ncbi:hypothetical protein [Arthrobacter sp. GMC3]|uniref:hypothetical protein n=1 Tax=Arthrobacter sp. GMC3 TaxID=2058894 RepID=UPI000CE3F9BF|nr:hypothetical protein [Arthrobacter sp. GMC3]
MTNQLFRDYLDEDVPEPSPAKGGYIAPRFAQVGDMTFMVEWGEPIYYGHESIREAFTRIMEAYKPFTYRALPTDYGAQRGLAGLERAHFNEAVDELAHTTPWTREECATALGRIMDAAERAELGAAPMVEFRRGYFNDVVTSGNLRDRALWARQHRGTGPAPEPLRMRGRTNRYKEKR